MRTVVELADSSMNRVKDLADIDRNERAGFLLCSIERGQESLSVLVQEVIIVCKKRHVTLSPLFLELKTEAYEDAIQRAFQQGLTVAEFHTHPQSRGCFSTHDLEGIQEANAYVRWRLGCEYYGALVFSRDEFDGLLWANDGSPIGVDRIRTDGLVWEARGCAEGLWNAWIDSIDNSPSSAA